MDKNGCSTFARIEALRCSAWAAALPGANLSTVLMEPLGSEVILYMLAGSDSFVARVDPRTTAQANQPFKLTFEMDRMHLFDRATQEAIT